jgi:hypothetical protein
MAPYLYSYEIPRFLSYKSLLSHQSISALRYLVVYHLLYQILTLEWFFRFWGLPRRDCIPAHTFKGVTDRSALQPFSVPKSSVRVFDRLWFFYDQKSSETSEPIWNPCKSRSRFILSPLNSIKMISQSYLFIGLHAIKDIRNLFRF